jgi:phosphoglycerate dehydrogenase-like enzyme
MQVLIAIYGETAAWTLPPEKVDELRRRFPGVGFLHATNETEMVRLIPDADAAFTSRLTPQAFGAARKLRWIHSPAAGVASMLFPAVRESEVLLTNSRGIAAVAVAEHAFALLLALARGVGTGVRRQGERRWAQEELGSLPTLQGRCLGIVGLGSIGQQMARIGSGFGMRIIGTRRRVGEASPPGVERVVAPAELANLLQESDVVMLAAPLTSETRALIGWPELRQMKPTAWLINVARGKLIREEDLVAALRAGTIAGAGLDVFEHEPLDPSSPLWSLPNVVITPHVAGFREGYWDAALEVFASNLELLLRGGTPANPVDRDAGY